MSNETQTQSSGLLSQYSREKLEEQLLKAIKQIKFFNNQNQQFQAQIQELTEKNKELESEVHGYKLGGFGIGSFGKRITQMFESSKPIELKFEINTDTVSVEPVELNGEESERFAFLKNENNELKKKLDVLEKDFEAQKEFSDNLQKKNENQEGSIEEYSNELELLRKTKSKLEGDNQSLQNMVNDLEKKVEKLNGELSGLKDSSLLFKEKSEEYDKLMEEHTEVVEQCEKLKSNQAQQTIRIDELQRENDKLRESLKKSMYLSQKKDEMINLSKLDYQNAVKENQELKQQNEGQLELISKKESKINDLTQSLKEVQERLDSGQGSIEKENKVKKMQKMVEKSNLLYAEMQEKAVKFEERVHILEKELHKHNERGNDILYIKLPKHNYILTDNGKYFEENNSKCTIVYNCLEPVKKENKEIQVGTNDESQFEYLKELIIQILNANNNSKNQLIPILLRFLKCDEDEIQTIMKNMNKRSYHFFSK